MSSYTFRAVSADAGDGRWPPSERAEAGVPKPPVSDAAPEVSWPRADAGGEFVDSAPDDAEPSTPEPSAPDPPLPETPLPETPPAPDPQYGCSFVEFCNADEVDGSGDQERCQHSGCTLEDAIRECRVEVGTICGDVQPPYVLVTLTDQRVILN